MYVKIQRSEKGGNKGSCTGLVNYLSKEDQELGGEKEYFFNHDRERVPSGEVVHNIDKNKGQLGKEDDKFYSVIFAPDEKELKHLGGTKEEQARAMKEYTRAAMDEYAKNFNKGLKGNDIEYYAKLEYNRKHKGTDPEVMRGEKKQGEAKAGNNIHVHVIVSRKDKANKIKLSPLTNHRNTSKGTVKGGFDRDYFQESIEKRFDEKFAYQREIEDSYRYRNTMQHGSINDKIEFVEYAVVQKHMYEQLDRQQQEQKQKEIQEKEQKQPEQKQLLDIINDSLEEPDLQLRKSVKNKDVEGIQKAISQGANIKTLDQSAMENLSKEEKQQMIEILQIAIKNKNIKLDMNKIQGKDNGLKQ